ncbi:hypothetical protein KC365_g120 [Hortaea werneckii]|nr:hypothetical protein KC365_g120 [Hortaea werneckii]
MPPHQPIATMACFSQWVLRRKSHQTPRPTSWAAVVHRFNDGQGVLCALLYPKRSARREVGLTTTADAVDRIVAMVIYRRRSHLSGNPLLCAYCSIIGSRTSGF